MLIVDGDCVMIHVLETENSVWQKILSFNYVEFENFTQVLRFGNKYFDLLSHMSHITGSSFCLYFFAFDFVLSY